MKADVLAHVSRECLFSMMKVKPKLQLVTYLSWKQNLIIYHSRQYKTWYMMLFFKYPNSSNQDELFDQTMKSYGFLNMLLHFISISVILHIINVEADQTHPLTLWTVMERGVKREVEVAVKALPVQRWKTPLPQTHAQPWSQNVILVGKMS